MHRAAVPALALAVALTGCMTRRVDATPSPAIVQARAAAAGEKAHPVSRCASVPAMLAPVNVPFAYGQAEISEAGRDALDEAAAWLACRPAAAVVVTGEADASGAKAIQATLPARRAQAVRDYLSAHGVTGERLLAAKPATGLVVQIAARGRGW